MKLKIEEIERILYQQELALIEIHSILKQMLLLLESTDHFRENHIENVS